MEEEEKKEEQQDKLSVQQALDILENGFHAVKLEADSKIKQKNSNKQDLLDRLKTLDEKRTLIKKVCELIKKGYSQEIVAKECFMTKRQVAYYHKKLQNNSSLFSSIDKAKIKISHIQFLEIYLSNPQRKVTSLSELKQELIKKFPNETFSLSTIHKMVKQLNYSRKKAENIITYRNTTKSKQKRHDIALEIIRLLSLGKKFIYIDETSFNMHTSTIYGYALLGKKFHLKVPPRLSSVTVICAISQEQVLGYQIIKGGVNARVFGAFLIDLMLAFPQIIECPQDYLLFMDNASIHKARIIAPFINNFQILYNAPYSPFLNPIENVFGLIKHYYRRILSKTPEAFLEDISRSFKRVTQKHVRAFFHNSLTYLKNSLLLNDIE